MKTSQRIHKVDGEVIAKDQLMKWIERLLSRLPDGEVVLEIRPTDITDAQRRYYFQEVGNMASYFGTTKDNLHKRLKMAFFPDMMIDIGKNSITDLDKDQMTEYIDSCIRFSAEQGYIWGDPEEYKHL